jgi:hypothetical protein
MGHQILRRDVRAFRQLDERNNFFITCRLTTALCTTAGWVLMTASISAARFVFAISLTPRSS